MRIEIQWPELYLKWVAALIEFFMMIDLSMFEGLARATFVLVVAVLPALLMVRRLDNAIAYPMKFKLLCSRTGHALLDGHALGLLGICFELECSPEFILRRTPSE